MIRVRFKKKKICPAMLQMDVTKNKMSRYVCDKSIHEQDKAICTCLLVSIIIKKKVIKQDTVIKYEIMYVKKNSKLGGRNDRSKRITMNINISNISFRDPFSAMYLAFSRFLGFNSIQYWKH